MAANDRSTARATAPRAPRAQVDLGRIAPSSRSILLGLALLALGFSAYVVALQTSVFAVRSVVVSGGTPRIRAEVRAALTAERGRSLLRIGAAELERRLAGVTDVQSTTFDRNFPTTLRVVVTPERPVLVLRRGADAWLVSARGRVLRELHEPRRSALPRVWVKRETDVRIGSRLGPDAGGAAAAALAPLAVAHARGSGLSGGVLLVRAGPKELTLVRKHGPEIRLGDLGDLRLKLAIARRVLAAAAAETASGYVDVSVPERPVLNSNTQVEGTG